MAKRNIILFGLLLVCGSSLFASPTGLYDVLWWKWFKTYECRFTPDDSKIYVNSDDGVGIFDTKTGNQDTIISGVWYGTASYDGTKYYKVENGVIKEYDFLTLKHIRDFDMKGIGITSSFYTSNPKYITTRNLGGLGFSIWDTETGTYLDSMHLGIKDIQNRITEAVREVFITPDLQKLIVRLDKWQDPIKQSDPQTTIREHTKIMDFKSRVTIKEIESTGQLYISKSGKYIICQNYPNDGKTALKVYSIDGELLFSVPGWASSVSDIDFSIDDRFMLVSFKFSSSKLELWDLEKKILLKIIEADPKGPIASSRFNKSINKIIFTDEHKLFLIDIDGISSIETNNEIQATITYPNPSTTELILEFSLTNPNHTSITINDITGKQIKEVFNCFLNEGLHKQNIDLRELQTGTYYLRIQSGNEIKTEKIVRIH